MLENMFLQFISTVEGYVEEINVSKVRQTAKLLKAIRKNENEEIDVGAGIKFNKKIGDKVNKGETLAYIYTNNETAISKVANIIREAYVIDAKKIIKKKI